MLTDSQYELIEKYLPVKRRPPEIPHRQALEGMLYVHSQGCSWRGLPKEYGHWHTVYTRFKRWSESGLFGRILHELHKEKVIDIGVVFLDSTVIKTHHSASGAQKKRGLRQSGGQKAD